MLNALNRVFTRIVALVIIAVGALLSVGYFVAQESRSNLAEQKKADVRHIVEGAYNIVADLDKHATAGEMTRAQAQAEAKKVLGAIRYEGNEYIFVYDHEGTLLLNATKEIVGRIDAVVGATGQAVAAIESVDKTITRVNGIAATISAAVEEQGAATSEIARAISHTAEQSESLAASLGRLLNAAGDTDSSSQTVVTSAAGLTDQVATLKRQVEQFVARVAA